MEHNVLIRFDGEYVASVTLKAPDTRIEREFEGHGDTISEALLDLSRELGDEDL